MLMLLVSFLVLLFLHLCFMGQLNESLHTPICGSKHWCLIQKITAVFFVLQSGYLSCSIISWACLTVPFLLQWLSVEYACPLQNCLAFPCSSKAHFISDLLQVSPSCRFPATGSRILLHEKKIISFWEVLMGRRINYSIAIKVCEISFGTLDVVLGQDSEVSRVFP